MRYLYNIGLTLLISLGWPFWLPVVVLHNKRRQVFLQRLGLGSVFKTLAMRGRRPLWIHALSVGEVAAAIPLVDHILQRWPQQPVVFSVSTVTGMAFAQNNLASRVQQLFFFPWDIGWIVRRVLRQFAPRAVVLVESDIWPNFTHIAAKSGIPLFLVNARLSDRSLARYQQFRSIARLLYAPFNAICTQSASDALHFERLGQPAHKLHVCGNLKFDRIAPSPNDQAFDNLRRIPSLAPPARLVVAGSTHAGEEELLLSAFQQVRLECTGLILVLAPRDPQRAAKIPGLAAHAGLHAVCLSSLCPDQTFQVLVVDRIGLLQSLYALAEIAVIGGSFIDYGGHNPLEAVLQGKPVICGPFMGDFKAIMPQLHAARAIVQLSAAPELAPVLRQLLHNPKQIQALSRRAATVAAHQRGVARRVTDALELWMQQGR